MLLTDGHELHFLPTNNFKYPTTGNHYNFYYCRDIHKYSLHYNEKTGNRNNTDWKVYWAIHSQNVQSLYGSLHIVTK